MSRYARQEILPELGAAGQARLGAAHVLAVGAGGLAAHALPLLIGAGIGRLTLLDPDHVEIGNLHRQTFFTEADIGLPKAAALAARLKALNARAEILPHIARLTPASAPDLVASADLVLDCADSHAASFTLSDACAASGTPLITASVLGLAGYAAGCCGGAPSLRALFPGPPQSAASCAEAGVLGPAVAMVGAAQAQMALAQIAGLAPAPLGLCMRVDLARMQSRSFRFDAAPEPEIRFPFLASSQLRDDDLIVDLAASPPDPLPSPIPGRRLVLSCQSGLRAWRSAGEIHPKWPGDIALLAASTS